jgi:hypothetical protein
LCLSECVSVASCNLEGATSDALYESVEKQ